MGEELVGGCYLHVSSGVAPEPLRVGAVHVEGS